jgi:Flp pilus assembly protein TadG
MRTPSTPSLFKPASQRGQRGVTIVEFALVALIFFTLLIGIMEFGRWLFTLNAASEATRWGARVAVVCDRNDAAIKARMRAMLNGLKDEQISINYSPSACDTSACMVTVQLNGVTFTPLIPFMGVAVPVPPFTTTLPREHLNSDGGTNPVCK